VTSRSAVTLFPDMLAAIEAIHSYRAALRGDGRALAIDAIKYHLVVIGEAVGNLSAEARMQAPEVPWASIKGLRNLLTHEYFDIREELLIEIIEGDDLLQLEAVARRLSN